MIVVSRCLRIRVAVVVDSVIIWILTCSSGSTFNNKEVDSNFISGLEDDDTRPSSSLRVVGALGLHAN